MKLNNYANFIKESDDFNESEERKSYKKTLYSFFKSKGIYDENSRGNGNAIVEIYYYGVEDPVMYISLRFEKDGVDLATDEFLENYTKSYPIYLSMIEIFKEVSHENIECNNTNESGVRFSINHEDLKKSTNNELRSLLGLNKFKL